MSAIRRIITSIPPDEEEVFKHGTTSQRLELINSYAFRRVEAETKDFEDDVRRRRHLAWLLIAVMLLCVLCVTAFTAASAFYTDVETGQWLFRMIPEVLLGAFAFYGTSVVAAALAVVRYTFPQRE